MTELEEARRQVYQWMDRFIEADNARRRLEQEIAEGEADQMSADNRPRMFMNCTFTSQTDKVGRLEEEIANLQQQCLFEAGERAKAEKRVRELEDREMYHKLMAMKVDGV
tara:strand:+ start:366 stop:695 length:330 start_codon:yes stop_codon:yes gene_type:complete